MATPPPAAAPTPAGFMDSVQDLLTGYGNQRLETLGWEAFLVLMLLSLLSSAYLSWLYLHYFERRSSGTQLHRAFPLLGMAITAIFICIQFSLPLSLGLLGALSIVRFRTPIKEPEEISFLMVVIAASICCATFNLVFLGIVLALAWVACAGLAMASRAGGHGKGKGMIVVTMPLSGGAGLQEQTLRILREHVTRGALDGIAEGERETTLTYSFIRLPEDRLLALQERLRTLGEGVRTNIFFNRTGAV